jgi:hypothetical protein
MRAPDIASVRQRLAAVAALDDERVVVRQASPEMKAAE